MSAASLGLPDGELAPTLELRAAIAREVEGFGPDLVITHYPRRALAIPIEASHPDHVAVGEATLVPALGAGLEVWAAGYEAADHAVDVSDFLQRKERALLCHASQLGGGGVPEWTRHEMAAAGDRAGCCYAEEFVREPPRAVGWRGS